VKTKHAHTWVEVENTDAEPQAAFLTSHWSVYQCSDCGLKCEVNKRYEQFKDVGMGGLITFYLSKNHCWNLIDEPSCSEIKMDEALR